ncbi:MAG TPA: J domain-containing protein [Gemmatimonadaceae bacterium]|nr:J domain-containing protein [Gemmatimonadaceae bacterium]
MAPTNADYYGILGVSSTASGDEIKKQYRRLAKKYHPDSNKSDPKAAERFKEISEAYTVIGDDAKRKQYDDMRKFGPMGGFTEAWRNASTSARRPGPTPGGAPSPGQPGANARFDDFDIGGLGGLGDLFGSVFGGRGKPRASERGQDVELTVEIPFRTAATGGKVPVELDLVEECPVCKGNGAAPGAQVKACGECSGRGTISFGQGGFAVNRPCPACLGRGNIPSEKCGSCNGAGQVRSRRKVNITVPSGAESGTRVRLKEQGSRGQNGGPTGDLIITFQVQPDRAYTRDGLDLILGVPINIAQATLGSKIQVKTLGGAVVALRIPGGTPSGKRFRVRGQGIEKEGKRGDLLVDVQITVPEKLNEEQEKLMRDFAEAGGLKF